VVVLRQPVKCSLVAQTSRKSRQPERQFLDPSETTKVWEYAVLVTHADYSLEAMGVSDRPIVSYDSDLYIF